MKALAVKVPLLALGLIVLSVSVAKSGEVLAPANSPNVIAIGDTSLVIPSPRGFVPLTPKMPLLYELQEVFVAAENEELIAFIPSKLVNKTPSDEAPAYQRRFSVQVYRLFRNRKISPAVFGSLKSLITDNSEQFRQKHQGLVLKAIDAINKGVSEQHDVDLALSAANLVIMPVHQETGLSLSYSHLVTYDIDDVAGMSGPFVVAGTSNLLHIKGKILLIYCYAEASGLQWSRQASQEWLAQIISANTVATQ